MTAVTPWKAMLFLAGMLLVAGASAQTEASGTITGSLGGEGRSGYTIHMATEGEAANTAEWANPFGGFYTFSLQGHREVGFRVEGTIGLEFSFFAGLPEGCPCSADEASIIYFASSEMLRNIYEGEDASITVTELEVLD